MSCGSGCPGDGGSFQGRIPSFIPSDQPRRQRPVRPRARPRPQPPRTPPQRFRPTEVASPGSPCSPLAASSPVRHPQDSPIRQVGAVAPNYGAPMQMPPMARGGQLPRFVTPPRRPDRPVGVAASVRRPPPPRPMDQTFVRPGGYPPVPQPPPRADRTFDIPGRTPPRADRTFDIPGRLPPVSPLHPGRPRFGDTYIISHDDSGLLADSIMDDMGDDDDWDVSTAVSIEDFEDDEGDGIEDEEPSFADVVGSTMIEDNVPPGGPCGAPGPNDYFPNLSGAPQLDDIGPDVLYDSGEYLDDVTPPSFANISDNVNRCNNDACTCCKCGGEEESSLGLLGNSMNDDLMEPIAAMAEAPSNLSVFDAEELNRTTAPRTPEIDIPRTRIWQCLMNNLNEIDNSEELEFEEFVEGIQQQRRQWIESMSG